MKVNSADLICCSPQSVSNLKGLYHAIRYLFKKLKRVFAWYIYPQFLVHENHKIAHKNAQKSFINFKPRIGNVAITGTNFVPPKYDFMCNWPC